MCLFKSRYEMELDMIIDKINMNMSNNYKDNAQSDLRDFEKRFEELQEQGALKPKAVARYDSLLGIYREKLKGYTHKDQKPYWT